MCGIVGFSGEGTRVDLVAMTRALAHRGPDEEGFWVDEASATCLGHRRLSILDLEGGGQPMWNAEGTLGVVYNGEIYNHVELRAELEKKGHRFQSDHSDTEVLIHGYAEWGEELPIRLNGMFAFALLDRPRRRIFLARDRFGEKPLYYAHRGRFLAFASELSALCLHPSVDTSLSPRNVQKLFAYGFVPAPGSLVAGVSKLPAGAQARFEQASGAFRVQRYWRFLVEPEEALDDGDEPHLVEELRHLIRQAVCRRLISDVPLGIFLSGGIDSSSVLGMAAREREPSSIETFTVGFREPTFDESTHARLVATAVGTRHHEEILDLSAARELIPTVLQRADEPFADPSLLPTYLLCRFASQHVTVALSGDGADELFAGYDPFRALAPARLYARFVPRHLHRAIHSLVQRMPRSTRNMSLDFRLKRTLLGLSHPQCYWNPIWMGPLAPDHLAEVFADPLPVEELFEEALEVWEASPSRSLGDRTLDFYTNFYLQEGILKKVDQAAMMNSLESRAVFLDNDLVEFCRRLPYRFKYRHGRGKYLLRKAVADVVPRSVLERPKKGFGIPLVQWLDEIPADPPLHPVAGVDTERVASYWRAQRRGSEDHRLFLWCWLAVQLGFAEAL